MNKRLLSMLLFITILVYGLISSCQPKPESTDDKAVVVVENTDPLAKGKAIYDAKCIVCHMADGKGLAPNFPPLAGSDYLLQDPIRAVTQVLNGSNTAIVVNGITYTMPMTPQVDNYEDAVAVVNYITATWGNSAKALTVDDVKHIEIVR